MGLVQPLCAWVWVWVHACTATFMCGEATEATNTEGSVYKHNDKLLLHKHIIVSKLISKGLIHEGACL